MQYIKRLCYLCMLMLFVSCKSAGMLQVSGDGKKSIQRLSSDTLFMNYLKSKNLPIVAGNQLTLLTSGEDKFRLLFEDIRKARHHIHLEYFNFRNDSIGYALFSLLSEKARQGVDVRVIFDDFGNKSNNRPLKKRHLRLLNERGVEIIQFDPIAFPYVNHVFSRDHQKIAVIDGLTGYVGGMNVADYYIKGLEEVGEWHDVHLRIEGPVVKELQKDFLVMWNKETGQDLLLETYLPETPETVSDSLSSGHRVAIVQRVPHSAPKIMRQCYIAAIKSARDSVRIINPYFVPPLRIRRALKNAVQRGVKVEIMIPGKSDIPFTPEAGFYYANKMRKYGAQVYVFNNGFHHSKVMMIDGLYSTVGSTNLDSRSLRHDYEVNAFVFDKTLTAELDAMFHHDLSYCKLYTKEQHADKGVWRRFVGWFAHLFTLLL